MALIWIRLPEEFIPVLFAFVESVASNTEQTVEIPYSVNF